MSKIQLSSDIVNDKFTEFLYHAYDIQNKEKTITEIPIPNDDDMKIIMNDDNFNIFLICGRSGSGKSTILQSIKHGPLQMPSYDYGKCVISQFPKLSEEEVCDLLSGVGLSSVPIWLRKPNQLSNGEKARLDVCKSMYDAKVNGNQIVFIDEFTSVVNRDAAKSMSFALQRYARKNGIKLIISSCHFDIIDWLQPDYVFNLNHKNEKGDVDVEKLIYRDGFEYKSQQTISDNDALTEQMPI